MKLNYILIPLVVFLAAAIGSYFTSLGLGDWYEGLTKPAWTPAGGVIGMLWTIIFVLMATSLLLFWNAKRLDKTQQRWVGVSFVINLVLNISWSYIFFARHLIGLAVLVAALLGLSVFALIFLTWPGARKAAILLIPYASWVLFATYLNYTIWSLN